VATVTVYEKRQDPRKDTGDSGRSINLIITKRGMDALNAVGLGEETLKISTPVVGRFIHNKGNEIVQPYNANKKQKNLSVVRKALNVLIINHAEKLGVFFLFNEEVQKVDLDQRKIEFTSGSAHGGQVFGCDGVHSICREALGAATLECFPKGYMELSFTDDAPFNKDYLHIWPREKEMIMALPNRDQGFTVTWFGDSDVDPDLSINFSESMKHFRMDKIMRPSKLVSVKTERWNHEDWLLLLGDACHGIVPFYGQGMNCGFEDITVLFSALSKYDREEAFNHFCSMRKTDTDAILELSKRNFDIMAKHCASSEYQAREAIKRDTSIRYPLYQPIYVLVTHSNTPYSLCLNACALENELVEDETDVDAWMKEKWMPFLLKHNLVIPTWQD
jgi:kynurenine 3-monooxygenase